MSGNTEGLVIILSLGALAFLAGVLAPGPPHPVSAYRLHIVAAGLFLWILAVILQTAGVL